MAVPGDQRSTEFQYQKKGETVTSRVRILGLLRQLIEARSLISVSIPPLNEQFNSAILEADADRDMVLLDELTPTAGHTALLKNRRLVVHARLKGVDVIFASRLAASGRQDGVAIYRLPFPERVEYHQMRADFRAPVAMSRPVGVRLRPSSAGRQAFEADADVFERMVADGHLHDISQGGIGAVIEKGATRFQPGTRLSCALRMPDGEPLHCEVEIRNMGEDPRSGRPRVGARFINLEPEAANRIARLVLAIQRELIRKQGR